MEQLPAIIDAVLGALAPMLTEIIATGLSLLFGALLMAVRRYAGLKAEALLRDALNQAIATGVARAVPGGGNGSIEAQAIEYAKRSSPGAIKALRATDDVLFDKARAAALRN